MGLTRQDIQRYKRQLGGRWNEERAGDEQPAHNVALNAYAIGRYPVTGREFEQFVRVGGYTDTRWRHCWTDGGWDWLLQSQQTAPRLWDDSRFRNPNYPVVGVTWFEAVAYCNWLNHRVSVMNDSNPKSEIRNRKFRLPTEAEWEYAVRGQEQRLWASEWDDEPLRDEEIARRCNARLGENYVSNTTPVGIYPLGVTSNGIHDVAGNVWEWCSSLYLPYPYRSDDGREDRGQNDPETLRVLRGGSWIGDYGGDFRAAIRDGTVPSDRDVTNGFRCSQGL